MKVAGEIQSTEKVVYYAWVNVSDSYYYMLSWINGQGAGVAFNTEEGSGQFDYDPDILVRKETISATFDLVGSEPTTSDIWGWAAEYTQLNDTTSEWWGDWIPGEYAPFPEEVNGDTSNDDNGDDAGSETNNGDSSSGDSNTGTPGFESILLFTALIAVIYFLKKKR